MKITPSNTSILVSMALVLAFSAADAQVSTRQGRTGGAVGYGLPVIAQSAGNYDFTDYDQAALQGQVLNVLEQRSKDDAQIIKDSIQQLSLAGKDLVNNQIKNGLQKMSDESMTGSMDKLISPIDFMAAKRDFDAAIQNFDLIVNGMLDFTEVVPKGQTITLQNRGTTEQAIQARFNINLKPVVDHYVKQISDISAQVNQLPFKIRAGNGAIFTQVGLVPSADFKNNQYTGEEIAQQRLLAAQLKVIKTRESAALKTFDMSIASALNDAINTYGVAYRHSFDGDGLATALKEFEQAFFLRSIFRAQYGVGLGAFKINYDLRSFNWDFFSSSNNITFAQVGVTNFGEMTDIHNKLKTALETQIARNGAIFGGENKYMLGRVTAALTFLKGQRNLVAINQFVLTNLLKDTEEEMKLTEPGGRRQLVGMISARYYTDKNSESYFKQIGRDASGVTTSSSDAFADAGQITTDTPVGAYRLAAPVLAGFSSRVVQAQHIEEGLAEIDSEAVNQRKAINNTLFQ